MESINQIKMRADEIRRKSKKVVDFHSNDSRRIGIGYHG